MLGFLKDNLHPSHITCALVLLTPGTVMLFLPSLARWGRRWVAAVLGFYLLLSNPIAVSVLARTLTGYHPIASAADARGARVVVLLGAGSVNLRASGRQLLLALPDAGMRVLEAARLSDLLDGAFVIASGGVTDPEPGAPPESFALQRALVEAGVRPDRILLESESQNTHDEAIFVKRILAERGLTDFVLVTSPLHMRRSLLTFEAQGMHPIPSPSLLVPERSTPVSWWLPNDVWLRVADAVIYEWLARGYYWWRGWLP